MSGHGLKVGDHFSVISVYTEEGYHCSIKCNSYHEDVRDLAAKFCLKSHKILYMSVPFLGKWDGNIPDTTQPDRIANGKSVIEYHLNGNKHIEQYILLNGNLHREDGPAYNLWYENGSLELEQYFLKGGKHRENGPAMTRWYENGSLCFQEYMINGKGHRDSGPSFECYYENGQKEEEVYMINGKYHRTDGPAHTQWESDGKKTEFYFFNDEAIECSSDEEFKKIVKLIAFK